MRYTLVLLCIGLAVICLSTSSVLVRYATAPALVIAFYRMLFTALISSGVTAATGGLKVSRGDFSYALLSGFFLALHFSFWFTSLSYTSIASSVLFTNLQVIFVWLFSVIFLHEPVRRHSAAGILLAVTGSVLIGISDLGQGHLKGDLLSLASGLFFAIYLLIGRRLRRNIEIWPYTAMVTGTAALVLIMAGCLVRMPITGYPRLDYLLFLLMALLPGLGGHTVLNWALRYVKAPVVAVSVLGESVGASILGYLFFNEALTGLQALGGLLILGGIYWAVTGESTSTT